ncbi:MAG: hypothetical protein WBB28_01340 [Crinalium sp.]
MPTKQPNKLKQFLVFHIEKTVPGIFNEQANFIADAAIQVAVKNAYLLLREISPLVISRRQKESLIQATEKALSREDAKRIAIKLAMRFL